ncbi:hypothetical protein [Paenibacillus campi]|uniref:hypothetical protein n=1 Tax=Paenibacillus campi TaxID=3106031 RepID=UPI002B003D12|nr:hypothetical protein [Paenibacillus sp. SGZ-1014]
MEKQGKLFRKYSESNDVEIHLELYDYNSISYHELISKMNTSGFKQVIVHSEMMLAILEEIILKDIILVIHFNDETDDTIIQETQSLIKSIRKNPAYFLKLKELLKWTEDNNSIDITKIEVSFETTKIEVQSNGIVIGKNIEGFFDSILIGVLKGFL